MTVRVDGSAELDRYLKGQTFDLDALAKEVGDEFGQLHLVAVTGSIPAGYANGESDVDLWVLADRPRSGPLRFATHDVDALVDVDVDDAARCRRGFERLQGPTPFAPATAEVRHESRRTKNQVRQITRFACGVELSADAEWSGFLPSLRTGWLDGVAARWWELEARRLLAYARLLEDAKPLVAAVAASRAVTAGFKSFCAMQGLIYPHPKWVAVDLERMGRSDLIPQMHRAFHLPSHPTRAASFLAEMREIVDELLGPPQRMVLQVCYQPGVEIRELDDRALVSRWEMRTMLAGADAVPPIPDEGEAIYEGPLADEIPVDLRTLLAENMVFLVTADSPEG